jgi:hypothetical protein
MWEKIGCGSVAVFGLLFDCAEMQLHIEYKIVEPGISKALPQKDHEIPSSVIEFTSLLSLVIQNSSSYDFLQDQWG